MNHLIEQLKEHMKEDLEGAFETQESELLASIRKQREDPENEDKDIVLTVSMKGKLSVDKSKIETAFSFSSKTTVKEIHLIENPNQERFL